MQAQGGHDVVTNLRRSRCRERHEWHAVEGLAQLPQASIVQPEVVAPCASSAPAWPCTMQGEYLSQPWLNKVEMQASSHWYLRIRYRTLADAVCFIHGHQAQPAALTQQLQPRHRVGRQLGSYVHKAAAPRCGLSPSNTFVCKSKSKPPHCTEVSTCICLPRRRS